MKFDTAFDILIGHEGGFQKDYSDRGNWTSGKVGRGQLKGTKYGISAMSYPFLDIENIDIYEAKLIYKRDFWERLEIEQIPEILSFDLFDTAVNSGKGNAARILQRAVGVADDGWIGKQTLRAASRYTPEQLVIIFNAERLVFYTSLSTWDKFGKGWARRVANNLEAAVR